MSETPDVDTQREALAQAFDRDLDPLSEYASKFESTGIDPFHLFISEDLASRDIVEATRGGYERVFSAVA